MPSLPFFRYQQLAALLSLFCWGLVGYALYLQHVDGLVPCPMCIVQRYALIGLAVALSAAALMKKNPIVLGVAILFSSFGAFVAGRQSWLQWYPPEIASCGRDFYGMIENYALSKSLPMIFRGSGDCTKIDWTFLGLSIANWNFLIFTGIAVLVYLLAKRK